MLSVNVNSTSSPTDGNETLDLELFAAYMTLILVFVAIIVRSILFT